MKHIKNRNKFLSGPVNEVNVNDEDFGEDIKDEVVYEFGCIMLKVNRTDEWNKVIESIADEDVYESEEEPNKFGVESDPHVTVLYGTHDNDIDKEEIIETILNREHISLNVVDISMFENEKFDVLKFGIESEDLNKFNAELRSEYPYTNSYDDYEAHATIAYLKSGTGKKYIKTFEKDEVIEMEDLGEITYSRIVDGEKEKIKLIISTDDNTEEPTNENSSDAISLSDIRSKLKDLESFKEKMLNISDDNEYSDIMIKIEEELGEETAHILDKIIGADLDYSADFIHYHQNGMTGGEDTGEFLRNLDSIKDFLKTL